MVRSNPRPKAGVGHRAMAVQIAVPDVVFLVDAALCRAGVEQVEPLIALEALPDEGPGLIAPMCPRLQPANRLPRSLMSEMGHEEKNSK